MFVTNNNVISSYAKECWVNYPTVQNSLPSMSTSYNSTPKDFALMDSLLSKGQMDIGSSANVSQLSQSYSFSFDNKSELFDTESAVLAVLSQCAIDSTKKIFPFDISQAIAESKKKIGVDELGYPRFWRNTHESFSRKILNGKENEAYESNNAKINKSLICPMDIISQWKFARAEYGYGIPTESFLNDNCRAKADSSSIDEIKTIIEDTSYFLSDLSLFDSYEKEDYILASDKIEDMLDKIRPLVNKKKNLYMYLLRMAMTDCNCVDPTISRNKELLISLLYNANKKLFLSCFVNETP